MAGHLVVGGRLALDAEVDGRMQHAHALHAQLLTHAEHGQAGARWVPEVPPSRDAEGRPLVLCERPRAARAEEDLALGHEVGVQVDAPRRSVAAVHLDLRDNVAVAKPEGMVGVRVLDVGGHPAFETLHFSERIPQRREPRVADVTLHEAQDAHGL